MDWSPAERRGHSTGDTVTDPITLAIAGAIATGVATKAGESISAAAQNAIAALSRAVHKRFGGEPERESVLRAAEADPGSEPATADLAGTLQAVMDEDPAFAAEVQGLWSQVDALTVARDDAVINNFQGRANTSVQLRDVHGGLTIN
jgi:hypothetical protein